ncbi:MAG: GNAT family N-acetyltransferase, partial [Candidatus Marinimicrobia bacterium]|nr:GNAT family N-acetyltransferase [Candidatus Neomarinimicrobiota bacterium]
MILSFQEVTQDRWSDFKKLFGARGACGGCWCMYWRIQRKDFDAQRGEKNKTAMKAIIDNGEVPGILAYHDNKPIAWCSLAPRKNFSVLSRSRILKPVDEQPVWSVVCLFIQKSYRRKGVSTAILNAGCDYARSQGAQIIEGYPVEPDPEKGIPDAFTWTGIAASY